MSLSKFYNNKVVLITGASMGIGKELAKQVLTHGGKVVITGRNQERLQAVLTEFNQYEENILLHVGNVAHYEDNLNLLNKIIQRFGKLDVLINNAGMSAYGDVENLKVDVAREIIHTNIHGSLFPTMATIAELKKTQGSILFISSIAGFRGLPGYSLYSLSKMALTGLTQSMRIELQPSNVFVGIAYVGFTANEEEKRTLSPGGQLEKVPARPKRLTATRQQTAQLLLLQVARRKHAVTHSFLGKFTFLLNRYFPSAIQFFMKRNYHKQKKLNGK